MRLQRVDGTDVDNVAATALQHAGNDGMRGAHGTQQIGVDGIGPLVNAAEVKTAPSADVVTGTVDQHVDAAPFHWQTIQQRLNRVLVPHIERNRQRRRSDLLDQRRQPVESARSANNPPARLGDGHCNGRTQAAAGTRHQNRSTLYWLHFDLLFPVIQ